MMKKKGQPTAQELYKARKQREEEEKDANLPPGLINHGNTCFMNSTLQGLMATELLHNLVYFEPLPQSVQNTFGTSIVAHRSPQLTNGHGRAGEYEHSKVEGMPLGDVFIDVMCKAWDIQQSRRRESMSPKELLFTMGRKFDQYLDFRQQDAHEFLRHMLDAMRMEELDIIKQRQPPPPKEPRKRSRKHRTSSSTPPIVSSSAVGVTSAPLPSTPEVIPAEEKLESFVDMLFGGHLASILVCEKCKKVSLTYEEFNDLSLSIKPEDYEKGRKRDRFKRFARRIRGSLRPPGSDGGRERGMHRSSSVPAERLRRSLENVMQQEEEPPVNEGPRRKSFDHVAEEVEAEEEAQMDEARDVVREIARASTPRLSPTVEDEEMSTETSEDKERKSEEPKAEEGKEKEKADDESGQDKDKEKDREKERKDKEKEDAWGRFGRRLSVSMKKGMKVLDPGSPNRSVERGRKVATKDQIVPLVPKDGAPDLSRKSLASATRAYDSGSDMGESSDATHIRFGSPSPMPGTPSPLANPPITAPPRPPSGRRGTTLGGRRKKSPHAPKPSREEAAYLRQLLADIHTSNANPFSVLHQALSGAAHGTPPAAAAQAAWAKMGHLPGIEECLRMFTAVEILDGENMVGCRRCWKIANDKYKPRRHSIVAEDDDDEDAASEGEGAGEGQVDGVDGDGSPGSSSEKLVEGEQPAEEDASQRPTSPSTETLSSPEGSPSEHISPASTSALQSMASLSDNFSDTTSMTAPPMIGSVSREAAPPPITSPTRPTTYGGLPIPSISTTAPESPVASRLAAGPSSQRLNSPLGVSPSDDSLLTPRGRRRPKPKADGPDNNKGDSSDDEYESDSDVSASTSAYSDVSSIASPSASPSVSPRASVENLQTQARTSIDRPQLQPSPSKTSSAKVSRSKQVILRRMYKRYLIADPPPILVVHLKRFHQTGKTPAVSFTGGVKKLDEFVAFPEYLDLAPFLAPRREDFGLEKAGKVGAKEVGKDGRCMYRLYAVVVHIGNMLGGHYVAYTALPPSHPTSRSEKTETTATSDSTASASIPQTSETENASKPQKNQRQWAYISDTVVRLTTIEEVLKAKAYICMYERI